MNDISFLEMFMSVFFYMALIIGYFIALFHVIDIDAEGDWKVGIFKYFAFTFLIAIPVSVLFWVAYSQTSGQ